MKKIILILSTVLLLGTPVFAQVVGEPNDTSEAWDNIKKNSKDALKKTGNFLKAAGSDIKEGVNNLKEVKCLGTWSYKSKNCTTIISINDNGTMRVEQKEGFVNSVYYEGTYTQILHSLNFEITEKGSKSWVVNADDQKLNNSTWFITYSVQEDKNKMKFTTSDIPADADGTDFSKGIIFTRK